MPVGQRGTKGSETYTNGLLTYQVRQCARKGTEDDLYILSAAVDAYIADKKKEANRLREGLREGAVPGFVASIDARKPLCLVAVLTGPSALVHQQAGISDRDATSVS